MFKSQKESTGIRIKRTTWKRLKKLQKKQSFSNYSFDELIVYMVDMTEAHWEKFL